MLNDVEITDSEMYLVRLMRENNALAAQVAELRAAIRTATANRNDEVAALQRQVKSLQEGIAHLTKRVQAAEGQR